MRAGLDPTLPEALTAFDIQTNPADRLPSLAQFLKALDRALTLPELHAFWRRVETAVDSPHGRRRRVGEAFAVEGVQHELVLRSAERQRWTRTRRTWCVFQ